MAFAAAEHGRCFPSPLVAVTVLLACVDGVIAIFAFSQLIRMHMRNQQLGWTRQKVFHLVIGSSNTVAALPQPNTPAHGGDTHLYEGYSIYFISNLLATCKGWLCWSNACGFILMAFPTILFLAAFLLLLSFWVDLCHQANDEDEEDEDSYQEAFLEKIKIIQGSPNLEHHRPHHRHCCPFLAIHVGSRQKFVILVIFAVFVLMVGFAVLIWIGMGKNPIDSSTVARVYIDFFAIAILLLAGALAVYGLMLFLKMSKVRSDNASSEMWKVAGLAIVSFVCFTSSAAVALATDVPLLYHWHPLNVNGTMTSILIVLYYFIGSSVPSAFVLWIMRELPPPVALHSETEESIAFISDATEETHNAHRWTTVTSSQNQASRASPI